MLLRLKSKTNPPGGIRTSNNVVTIIYVFFWHIGEVLITIDVFEIVVTQFFTEI